ncbi:MAG TPA: hypothetical protein VNF29_15900 [Candidatus Binataceae bacterium]|nr:hypothetical protein [Candidatus Binataceae bacterium]
MLWRITTVLLALAMLTWTGGVVQAELGVAAARACCSSDCPAPVSHRRDATRCCGVATRAASAAPAKARASESGAHRHRCGAASWFTVLMPPRRGAVTMIARDESPPGEAPSPMRLCSFQL